MKREPAHPRSPAGAVAHPAATSPQRGTHSMFTESHAAGRVHRYSAKRNLQRHNFFCEAPQARQVFLVGDFNNWDPQATPMTRQPDGRWAAGLELRHGYHRYRFLVDGQGVLDLHASGKTRDEHGQPASLIAIS